MRNKPEPSPKNKPQPTGGTSVLQYVSSRPSIRLSPIPWLTYIAFAIALIVVIARLTTPDSLRDPWEVMPGGDFVPAAPGPATGLVFDLLACLPALLILARRALDSDYRLSLRWSHAPLFALATWAVLSTTWASDKFAAAITSAHFFAAACLLWAMSQLVKTAGRFRFVAAVCFGLLLVLVVQSAMYKFIDVPMNTAYWNEHKEAFFKAHNMHEGSFSATQFAQKLTRGELVGFFNSANTFAAVGVLLFAACIGIGIQKLVDRDPPQWVILIIVSIFSVSWILFWAASKAAAATPFVGTLVLCLFLVFHQRLRSKHRLTYFGGVAFVALVMLAVIGHGLHHHGLFAGHLSNSLDFRWKYWVASSAIFKSHPLIGIGWSNFGLYYLAHRLPEAAEEIKDPHSFLVRFFVELGLVGGVLCILWLLRLAWELTLPKDDSTRANADDSGFVPTSDSRPVSRMSTGNKPDESPLTPVHIVPIFVLGMLLSILATVDFSMSLGEILLMAGRPILYLLVLMMGGIAASLRSSTALDDRSAPWIYYCTVTGLGLFLLHNLIDFSWFEPGAMFVFMALIGSAQGMAAESPGTSRRPVSRGRVIAIAGALVGGIALFAIAVAFVMPVIAAEESAASANEAIRTAPMPETTESIAHFKNALDDLKEAANWVPYNSDYLYRQASVLTYVNQDAAARTLLDRIKRMNPQQTDAYLLDANIQLRPGAPSLDQAAVKADFGAVLALNPNDVSLHIQYAKALARFGLPVEAKQQYEQALAADAALPIGEPKRLSAPEIEQFKKDAGLP